MRALLLGAVLLLAATGAGLAQDKPPLGELRWLDPSAAATAMSETPRRWLDIERRGGRLSPLATLGELAFRSPRILGGDARLGGLSCNTCHPNGASNRHFFVAGLSDRPGNVDVSNRLFNRLADDGLKNPLNIPSLRGVAQTAPYGHDGRVASLRAFNRAVIVTEFDGSEPAPWLLDALIAYERQLAFLPGAPLGPDGRLTAAAGAAALRGQALFLRAFPKRPELSCAACHPPAARFTDGRRHDVGTGGVFDSPTLLNLAETAPYLHDGRAEDLAAVVAQFDTTFQLGLTAAERSDLVAYLAAVGAAPAALTRQRLADDLDRVRRFLALVDEAAEAEDARIGAFAAAALRFELGRIHQRLPQDGGRALRRQLVALSMSLRGAVHLFEDGRFVAARRQARDMQAMAETMTADAATAETGSLYDPKVLSQALRR